jgi:hypothetical protein
MVGLGPKIVFMSAESAESEIEPDTRFTILRSHADTAAIVFGQAFVMSYSDGGSVDFGVPGVEAGTVALVPVSGTVGTLDDVAACDAAGAGLVAGPQMSASTATASGGCLVAYGKPALLQVVTGPGTEDQFLSLDDDTMQVVVGNRAAATALVPVLGHPGIENPEALLSAALFQAPTYLLLGVVAALLLVSLAAAVLLYAYKRADAHMPGGGGGGGGANSSARAASAALLAEDAIGIEGPLTGGDLGAMGVEKSVRGRLNGTL